MTKTDLIRTVYQHIIARGEYPSNLRIIDEIRLVYGVIVAGPLINNVLGKTEDRIQEGKVLDLARQLCRETDFDRRKLNQVLNIALNTTN